MTHKRALRCRAAAAQCASYALQFPLSSFMDGSLLSRWRTALAKKILGLARRNTRLSTRAGALTLVPAASHRAGGMCRGGSDMYTRFTGPLRTDYLANPAGAARRRALPRRAYWRALLELFAWLRWRCR
jgi:hypothetical protein